MSEKLREERCRICGINIWWDDQPYPLCSDHADYQLSFVAGLRQELSEAYEKAAIRGRIAQLEGKLVDEEIRALKPHEETFPTSTQRMVEAREAVLNTVLAWFDDASIAESEDYSEMYEAARKYREALSQALPDKKS